MSQVNKRNNEHSIHINRIKTGKIITILLLLCTTNSFAQTYTYDAQNRLTNINYAEGKSVVYTYDKVGNRTGQQIVTAYCPGTITEVNANVNNAISYQWQLNTGSGFNNMTDNFVFFGTQLDSLLILNPPTNYRGYQFRCAINTTGGIVYSNAYVLKVKATWQGTVDTVWSNSANWECNLLPDEYVDVVIPTGKLRYPTVSTNAKVYSLNAQPRTAITIKAGVMLNVKAGQ